MPAIDLSATPYYSMVISLAKSPLFSIAIHPMSVVHCKKVNRFRQVCHHWALSPLGTTGVSEFHPRNQGCAIDAQQVGAADAAIALRSRLGVASWRQSRVPRVHKVIPSHAAHGNTGRCRERRRISCGGSGGPSRVGSICLLPVVHQHKDPQDTGFQPFLTARTSGKRCTSPIKFASKGEILSFL